MCTCCAITVGEMLSSTWLCTHITIIATTNNIKEYKKQVLYCTIPYTRGTITVWTKINNNWLSGTFLLLRYYIILSYMYICHSIVAHRLMECDTIAHGVRHGVCFAISLGKTYPLWKAHSDCVRDRYHCLMGMVMFPPPQCLIVI